MPTRDIFRDKDLGFILQRPAIQTIFDHLSTGIALCSAGGIIQYANKAYLNMLGLTETEFVGKHVREIFSTADEGILSTMRDRVPIKCASLSYSGVEAISYRYPIINDEGEVIGGLIETISTSIDKKRVAELTSMLHSLEKRTRYYEKRIAVQFPNMHTFDTIIGESLSLRMVKQRGRLFAHSSEPVLICGESGTGKELFAQAIHSASPRALHPFITVNCAAIPIELMESELFGYDEGAFTGSKPGGLKGKFELANHGTIFLDEIAELPMGMQAKLLRVLEDGEIQKISHSGRLHADFRLIAATNKSLPELLSKGSFREDLYHRLSVLQLNIPPLFERREDLPSLIKCFIEQAVGAERAKKIRFTSDLLTLFNRYAWPGNVRELRNVLTYASCLMENDTCEIGVDYLPDNIKNCFDAKQESATRPLNLPGFSLFEARANAEKKLILETLARVGQNRSRAARELKISRNKLYKKMHDYGLL